MSNILLEAALFIMRCFIIFLIVTRILEYSLKIMEKNGMNLTITFCEYIFTSLLIPIPFLKIDGTYMNS